MGMSTVRAAVTAYLSGLDIPGVGHVFAEMPYYVADQTAFDQANPGLIGQSALFVHLWQTNESRISLPAVTGQKQVGYIVVIGILYRYQVPANLAVLQDDWINQLDTLIDTIKAGIRADPNLGAPTVVFQAGQDTNDLSSEIDFPVLDGGYVRLIGRIDMHLTEIIVA